MRPHHFHFQAPKDARSNLGGPPSEYKQGVTEEGPIRFCIVDHNIKKISSNYKNFLKPSNGRKYSHEGDLWQEIETLDGYIASRAPANFPLYEDNIPR